jgi:hypothetical protein
MRHGDVEMGDIGVLHQAGIGTGCGLGMFGASAGASFGIGGGGGSVGGSVEGYCACQHPRG